jgi:hypothetical protein
LVLGNYDKEDIVLLDIEMVVSILKQFENIIGNKVGIRLPRVKYGYPMKLIHVDAILIFLRMGNHRLKVI